ncbi:MULTISPECIES: GNAT family N-acetyltransferase [unclassified Idiomarina]|jgi:ribosomal protein S18 acetylase RimI-like enzyme|uniref:GNAT family N-acetyltransferase n=1 Tax=unclassified Idiomarina TaxID=2614829 RepID=UPI002580D27C|nr:MULTISPECIES: GNAT family N-acetyltransferase [unclassified Idiomarina]|tara:strand:+ start:11377 stop:11859 length:483 start_codon:yes stop_codon:yes gene_type:complete
MKMEKVVKSPGDCSDAELKSFEKLVTEGGEVALAGLRERIRRAEKLVFINDDKCVAVGAIKNPNARYKARVFENSGAPEQSRYEYELGWLYVSEAARGKGYGHALMESIVNSLSGRACFATTRENNASMFHLFSRFGFSKLGQPYKSESGDYSLVLYAKP